MDAVPPRTCRIIVRGSMRRFAALYDELDRTTSTNAKVAALAGYFRAAPPADAAWALFFLTGQRLKRLLPGRALGDWAAEAVGVPGWLLGESYESVGDAAETIALLVDGAHGAADGDTLDLPLSEWLEKRILPLRGQPEEVQRREVVSWWLALDRLPRFLLTKLLTGELRVGVSHTLVVRGLSEASGVPPEALAHRLMGRWQPSAAFFGSLVSPDAAALDRSRPYPFYLASPLDREPDALGARDAWVAEWKWDGIRAQVIRRGGETCIWSRGEELVTDRFPELHPAAARLPDGTVLDGEIVATREARRCPSRRCSGASAARRFRPRCCATPLPGSSPTTCSRTRAPTCATCRSRSVARGSRRCSRPRARRSPSPRRSRRPRGRSSPRRARPRGHTRPKG